MGAILGATLSSEAETPDIFTKHDLPIPGAYFAKHTSQKSTTIAISKSGQGVREQKQPVSYGREKEHLAKWCQQLPGTTKTLHVDRRAFRRLRSVVDLAGQLIRCPEPIPPAIRRQENR